MPHKQGSFEGRKLNINDSSLGQDNTDYADKGYLALSVIVWRADTVYDYICGVMLSGDIRPFYNSYVILRSSSGNGIFREHVLNKRELEGDTCVRIGIGFNKLLDQKVLGN